MIRIERTAGPPEVYGKAGRAAKALKRLEGLVAQKKMLRSIDFRLNTVTGEPIRAALRALFHDKCAYCESSLAAGPMDIDRFRPHTTVTDLEGKTDHGYWWLAYDWENLYPSCQVCSVRFKRNRFPVATTRAKPGVRGAALAAEGAYLLDPCLDEPAEHLNFMDNGKIEGNSERGVISIEILGLNRPPLVAAREAAMKAARLELLGGLARGLIGKLEPVRSIMAQLQDPARPYAAARRAAARRVLEEKGVVATAGPKGAKAKRTYHDVAVVLQRDGLIAPPEAEVPAGTPDVAAQQLKQELKSYSVENVSQSRHYQLGGGNRWIERIELENFKGIERLELNFPLDVEKGEPWLVLLGENSTGKSSILQAVALTLAGERVANKLGLNPRQFIRFGQSSARVRVTLSGDPEPEPIELVLKARSKRIRIVPAEPKTLLAAYGAMRIPRPGSRLTRKALSEAIHVENLFDSYFPLGDPTEWLLRRTDLQWEPVKAAIERMLAEPDDEVRRDRKRKKIEVVQSGVATPLASLSDGYQSAIALAVDVMRFFTSRWENMEDAVGIVILDEIGPHLHPRWKMKVVGQLRKAFPRVRFLATTHDPLCLRGLRNGEVVVMQRDERDRIVALVDLPPIEGLRVDQLLTSDFFGLHSAADPVLDAVAREYSILASLPKPSTAERQRLAELKTRLQELQVLGSTPAEQVRFRALGVYLDQRRTRQAKDAHAVLPDRAFEKLSVLWRPLSAEQQ